MPQLEADPQYRKCVAVVLRKNNLIFAAERIDIRGAWQLPQGGVDDGETYAEAAVRELFEETGISSVEFVKQTDNLYKYDFPKRTRALMRQGRAEFKGQEQSFVMFDFVGEDSEINLGGNPVREFRNWKWMLPRALLEIVVPFRYHGYESAFKELGLLPKSVE